MDDRATSKINQTFSKLEFSALHITGLHADTGAGLWLTPESVKEVNKEPRFWRAYAKFKIDPLDRVRVLREDIWKDKDTHDIHKICLYDGGLKFPEVCPVCLADETEDQVVEARIRRSGGLGEKVAVEASQEKANRIFAAGKSDRFWYVLSFSKHHGVEQRAVYFEALETFAGDRFKLVLTNREYAEQFAKLNNLKGTWISAKSILMRLLGVLGFIPCMGVAAFAGVASYYQIAEKEWDVTPMGLKTHVALFAVGLVASMALVYMTLKANKGESINPS